MLSRSRSIISSNHMTPSMTIKLVGWSLFSHMVSTGPMDRRSDIARP